MKSCESYIRDLVAHPKVAETRHLMHHNVSKQEHLLRSARISYRLAPVFGADRGICARAALLHDIDSRLGTWSNHGHIAARVAAQMGEPEPVCRAIVPHMFPVGPAPTSREGWVLVIADKLASLFDVTNFMVGLITGRSQRLRRKLAQSDPFYSARRWRRWT
ncbi:MAG: HD domain-containing protein [Deltaproteobacteria bacterium]|nr:HD domain-containing protein [Deltaproteobacteria bacterium]